MNISINVDDNKDVYFTSDFHLYHKNIVRFDNRPFIDENGEPDLEAMHETINTNWNNVVKDNDVVFYLGNLCFSKPDLAKDFLSTLNGKIHYIMGNHDKYKDIASYGRFESISDLVDLKISGNDIKENINFVLCHYPIYSWNRAHHGSYMIHGHSHMGLSDGDFHKDKRIFDVGCNGWNYTPVSYKKILEIGDKINFKLTTKHH